MINEKKFKVALIESGMRLIQFARQQNVSSTAILRVIKKQSKSERLKQAIFNFTEEHYNLFKIRHL